MCSPNSEFSPKNRRQRALVNLSLAIALLMSSFAHPAGQSHRNWPHLVSGLVLGVAIAVGICLFRSARHPGP
jgi:hypothetical protein